VSAAPAVPGRHLAWRLTVVPSLPSTSAFCCERAAAGEPAGLAVLARQQTAGRGSRGRSWSSPPGSLALSVLLRPDNRAATAGQWALLAGVAVYEALAEFLPDPAPLSLKWPNDLLLDGRKLGGILAESAAGEAGRITWLVLGFGANLAEAVPGQPPTAALAEYAPAPPPEQAAAAILERLAEWDRVLAQDGFSPVRAAWLARAHPIGSALQVRWREGAAVGGRFAGLAADGALLLQTPDGLRAYSTGDVLLGTGAGAPPLVEPARAPT
jgi:BirA family biotin operon repressor/biotin-[acetyl-CoA-carboxylase] ligase